MPIKIGKSARKVVRGAARPSFEYTHDYIKQHTTADLIEMYNGNTIPKKKRKIKVELERRNKLGKANVVFG
jgi:hypothetical protein